MAPKTLPSAEEYADVMLVVAGDMTKVAFVKKHRRAKETLYRWINELESGTLEVDRNTEAVVPQVVPQADIPDEVLENVDFDNGLWMALENVQSEMAKLNNERFEVTIHLDDNDPVLIVWLSDLHIGHTECDMRRLRKDLDVIRSTPGAYVILGGDLLDNVNTMVTGRGMHHEQLTPVEVQKYLVEEFVEYLGSDKILGMILGNHDEWSMKSDGFNPIAYLSKKVGVPYLGSFGFINLVLGDVDYKFLCLHQFRMNSSFNKTHAAKRAMDFIGDADVVFTGHKHDPAVESAEVRRKSRVFAQAGTYLKRSVYGQRLGFVEAPPDMPGVLLWPDSKDVIPFKAGFGRGVEILNLLRAENPAA